VLFISCSLAYQQQHLIIKQSNSATLHNNKNNENKNYSTLLMRDLIWLITTNCKNSTAIMQTITYQSVFWQLLTEKHNQQFPREHSQQ